MATAVMSARCDKDKLAFADKLARKQYGMSFAKYCGTIVLNQACEARELPKFEERNTLAQKQSDHENLMKSIREFGKKAKHSEVGEFSDSEIKDKIESRYL